MSTFQKLLLSTILLLSGLLLIAQIEVFFSPQDNPSKKLTNAIDQAKTRVLGAIYMLTDKKIAEALINAKKRGVDVQIILDRCSFESPWGKTTLLAEAGITIMLPTLPQKKLKTPKAKSKADDQMLAEDEQIETFGAALPTIGHKWASKPAHKSTRGQGFMCAPLMHNKFAIIDDKIWTGSFNWTLSANNKNHENALLISNEPEVVQKYLAYFNSLAKETEVVSLEKTNSLKRLPPATKKPLPELPVPPLAESPTLNRGYAGTA